MKKIYNIGTFLLLLIMTSLFMGNAIAMGIDHPEATFAISGVIGFLGLIPMEQAGVLSLALNAKNITYKQGTYNPGGIEGRVYYAFDEDIAKWPDRLINIDTLNATEFAELVTIPLADKFVFKTGKCFHELYCTLETGELKYSLIGARDGKSFSNSMEVSYPSNDEEFLGFLASSANRRLVFLVVEQNGKVKVLGTPKFPAQLETVEGTTGKLVEDPNTSVQTYLSKSPIPAAIYKAPIEIAPAA